VRVVDTRSDLGLVSLVDGVEQSVTIVGSLVPLGATAVSLTVTAVDASAAGFVSVRPGDATGVPSTSNLNVERSGTIANSVVVKLPTVGDHTGTINVLFDAMGTTTASTDVLIDVLGYYELASTGSAGPQGPAGADATVAITQQSICGAGGTSLCKIGMTGPGGGVIFFVDYSDQYANFNYLEAAPVSCEVQRRWSSADTAVTAARGWAARAVGQGKANTTEILAVFTTDTASNNAAQYAFDLANGVPGGCVTSKDDWFLGSLGEMKLIYDNLQGLGGFSTDTYWSSSETGASDVWYQDFTFGYQDFILKGNSFYVRPVRAF
jgi:hypothetical protein